MSKDYSVLLWRRKKLDKINLKPLFDRQNFFCVQYLHLFQYSRVNVYKIYTFFKNVNSIRMVFTQHVQMIKSFSRNDRNSIVRKVSTEFKFRNDALKIA